MNSEIRLAFTELKMISVADLRLAFFFFDLCFRRRRRSRDPSEELDDVSEDEDELVEEEFDEERLEDRDDTESSELSDDGGEVCRDFLRPLEGSAACCSCVLSRLISFSNIIVSDKALGGTTVCWPPSSSSVLLWSEIELSLFT
jgi:hypothetical protein